MNRDQKKLLAALVLLAIDGLAVAIGRSGPAGTHNILDEAGRVYIWEYSDYQCPACRVANPVVKQLIEHFGEKVRWEHRHYPLERIHAWARPASIAVECGGAQGKFTEFHDKIFDNQQVWASASDPKALFKDYAKALKLDVAKWEACVADPETSKIIDKHVAEGDERSIRSTPTFFVGGERLAGKKQLELKGAREIEKWIKKAEK